MLACGGTKAGQHVVAAVARAAVPVPPAVVAGEQDVELCQQVVVATGSGLDDRDPRPSRAARTRAAARRSPA